MSKKYDIYPEFQNMIQLEMETEEATVELFRQLNQGSVALLENNKSDDAIKITKEKMKSYDGEEIELQIFEPQGIKENAPCLVYYHGGGFMAKTFEHHVRLVREYTLGGGCKIVLVDYRIALDYPFPTSVEDCYAALKWVYENAESLSIRSRKLKGFTTSLCRSKRI